MMSESRALLKMLAEAARNMRVSQASNVDYVDHTAMVRCLHRHVYSAVVYR